MLKKRKRRKPVHKKKDVQRTESHDAEAGPSTGKPKWWKRLIRKRESATEDFRNAELAERHLLESTIGRSTTKAKSGENEGYGSYYMPCCPCSGHLADRPCGPRWCFTYKYIDWLTALALILIFCWGSIFAVDAATASPKGAMFTIGMGSILTYVAGFSSSYFLKIPPLLFMLTVGFIFVNCPIWRNSEHIGKYAVDAVTAFALTIMATKAALYFDVKVFMKHPVTILLLGIVPCSVEIFTVGGALYGVCGLRLSSAFTTATVFGNVSPVMISHSLVTLADAGYGARTGILSILTAAAPINSMLTLGILGVMGMLFQGTSGALITVAGQIAGILGGALVGALLAFLPRRSNTNATLQRSILHILSIMCVQLLAESFGIQSIGPLFNTAAAGATVNCLILKNWTLEVIMLKDTFEMIWHGLQPVAVVLASSLIEFHKMNTGMIWQSCVVYLVGFLTRIILTYVCTYYSGKPPKQRIFMALCWTARGLTQGILASTMIAYIKNEVSSQETIDIITITNMNLIASNVVGALLISFLGPKLLPRNEEKAPDVDVGSSN